MTPRDRDREGASLPLSVRLIPLAALALGLLMLYGEMFASGLAFHPSDPADPRYSEFVFEHSWRWLLGEETGGYFELPMAYPVTNMLAHSEPMLSFAPVFWLFRAVGFSSSSSHQLWMAAIAALNFGCFFALMRRSLRLDALAASGAAFLFAFGLPRVAQMGHSQLWPQMYIVGIVWGMHALLSETARSSSRRWGAPAVICAFALQAWGCLYNAVFLAYACLIVGIFAIAHPAWRARLLAALRETRPAGFACIAVALACLWPLVAAYLPIAGTTVPWSEEVTRLLQPRLGSLVYVWESSWFYGWMTTSTSLGQLPAIHEQALGLGLLTSGVVIYTIARHWRDPVVHAIALVVVLLWLPAIMWPGDHSIWWDAHGLLPGLSALRAISRIGLLLLIPASVALGVFLQQRSEATRPAVWIAIAALCLLEQGTATYGFPKRPYERLVEQIANRVDPNAEAFFYVGDGRMPPWLSHVNAIMAAQRARVPTINLYAARTPLEIEPLLEKNVASNPTMLREVEHELERWIERSGLDPNRIQRIVQYELSSPPASGKPARSRPR